MWRNLKATGTSKEVDTFIQSFNHHNTRSAGATSLGVEIQIASLPTPHIDATEYMKSRASDFQRKKSYVTY